jgi:hypothetical protein
VGKRFPASGVSGDDASLWVDGVEVAQYVTRPAVDPLRGPRPYLHPVRTLAGLVVTDVLPEDHPHHLGVSVAMQDVDGVNLWGGRTYVRGAGYTWLEDHGQIEHIEWIDQAADRLADRLHWCGPDGRVLLVEERVMTATAVDARSWALEVSYTLRNPGPAPVRLGSPATNGRPGKAGYGGFFWRLAPGRPRVLDGHSDVEEEVNGSCSPWVAAIGEPTLDRPYTLVFTGLGDGDHWFVRAAEYPGVCVALAFETVRVIEPRDALSRRHRVVVADGALAGTEIASLI